MDTLYPDEWLTFDRIAELFGSSVDAVRIWVKRNIADQWCRSLKSPGAGRPKTAVHYSAHPRLASAYEASRQEYVDPTGPALQQLDMVDLTVARLRMAAVNEYRLRKVDCCEAEACAVTCADWRLHPRKQEVTLTERCKQYQRSKSETVEVGGFGPSTLREWDRYFKGRVTDLLPKRKSNSGREREPIPDDLLLLIYSEAGNGPRSAWSRAIRYARGIWSGPWPAVSDKTLLRRARELDPEEVGLTLGRSGSSAYAKKHLPYIETDWNAMGLNDEWQIDDADEDFYVFLGDSAARMIGRPVIYRIVRCATRQVIATIASPCKITQAQVQALIGLALTDPRAGMPKRIRFERGTVACSDAFEALLNDFGIAVSRTGMDGGVSVPGKLADRAIGHSWGKPIIERSHRRHHEILWRVAGQVGGMERITAHQRTQIEISAAAAHYEKTGEQIQFLRPDEWPEVIHAAEEVSNTTPHNGLPLTIDLATGQKRHMTPNEFAATKKDPVQVLPEEALPLFFVEGRQVPVDAQGFLLDNLRFGKFDDGLQALAGQKVTVYVLSESPDRAFVLELGRSVELYQKRKPGVTDDQFEHRQHINKKKRNQHTALIERAQQSRAEIAQVIESTRVHNVAPVTAPEPMLAPAAGNRLANLTQAEDQARQERKNRLAPYYEVKEPGEEARPRQTLQDKQEAFTRKRVDLNALFTEETEEEFSV